MIYYRHILWVEGVAANHMLSREYCRRSFCGTRNHVCQCEMPVTSWKYPSPFPLPPNFEVLVRAVGEGNHSEECKKCIGLYSKPFSNISLMHCACRTTNAFSHQNKQLQQFANNSNKFITHTGTLACQLKEYLYIPSHAAHIKVEHSSMKESQQDDHRE